MIHRHGIWALLAVSCTGTIGETGTGGDNAPDTSGSLPGVPSNGTMSTSGASMPGQPGSPAAPSAPGLCGAKGQVGPSPLRRLTNVEYNNTVRDLLKVDARPADAFPKDGAMEGLTNNVAQQTFGVGLLGYYYNAGSGLAAKATASLPTLIACDPMARGEEVCARQFIETMGLRAFRRPLDDAEKQALFAVYTSGRTGGDFRSGIQNTLEAMLVWPQFLFRSNEAGTGTAAAPLDQWGLASRLSYLLWASMPDEALFEAARTGRLGTKDALLAQADRMLADPRAKEPVRRLVREWFRLDQLPEIQKDTKVYAAFSDALRTSMMGELERFVDHVLWQKGSSLRELMTSTDSFVDSRLAKLYGSPGPATGTEFQQVSMDPARRAGLLTKAGFLTATSKEADTGVAARGVFVRERVLCQPVPPVPENADTDLPAVSVIVKTQRQRFEEHEKNPVCGSCHKLFDPLGLALENYDGIGRWRDTENGAPIDASGELVGVVGGGVYKNAVEMSKQLGGSETFHRCAATVWFRSAFGRTEVEADACTLESLGQTLATSGPDAKGLLRAIVQSDAFRTRSAAN